MSDICNHTSVGVILENDNKVLLIKKKKFPFMLACPAGHVDEGESFEEAAVREIFEEVGLKITDLNLVYENNIDNPCRRTGGDHHYWKVYTANFTGDVSSSFEEVDAYIWLEKNKIKDLLKIQGENGLEPVWINIFSSISYI